jgi:hypothetical protein
MASPAESLVYLLTHNAGVTALVGTRIHPGKLPDGFSLDEGTDDLPAIAYTLVTERQAIAQKIRRPHYQLTVFAKTYTDALAVADACRLALDGYEGDPIRVSAVTNQHDRIDPDLGLFMIPLDVVFLHYEP